MKTKEAYLEKFWEKVDKTEGGCWEWRGRKNGKGYGMTRATWLGYLGPTPAHRVAWVESGRVLPRWQEGRMQLDHVVCSNPGCVNPEHLQLVTSRENTMREGSACIARANALKTHCPQGHEYTPENTRIKNRKGRVLTRFRERICRICARCTRQRARQKSADVTK